MNGSDNVTRGNDLARPAAGTGHFSAFLCAGCAGRFLSRLGSRRRRVRGVPQMVCAGCAQRIDKARGIAR
jgi:hypothetical protein